MKSKKKRHPVRRLFVLGAGASYSATRSPRGGRAITAPLDGDFSNRIADLSLRKPQWVGQTKDRVTQGWKDLQGGFDEFALEEGVIRQLSHLEFISAIHLKRKRSSVTAPDWLSDLTHLMCFVLRRAKESQHRTYESFAEKVFPSDGGPEAFEDRIVTFNYDDLLDRYLTARLTPQVVYFDRILSAKDASEGRHLVFDHPLLVKLHGSVNWRCSGEDFDRIVSNVSAPGKPHHVGRIWHEATTTPSPNDGDCPLMIPPLPSKPITSIEIFRYLWTKAYEYLFEAEHLIVCGYSLPAADRLARSLFGNFSNASLREVTVVDPDPEVITRWRSLLSRSAVGHARWTYWPDFEEYVQALDA